VARLNHPNIVQIYDFAEYQGRPYFAMEYVEGGSLERRLQSGPLPAGEAAALAETLARALHAVHREGIVHRDLKPANVLLTKDGQPKVADFGLAKLLDTEASLLPSGAVVGTASYMAPEQAAGKGREVKATADVYALGAILYHMLTGRPPFTGESVLDIIRQVIAREPKPLGLGRSDRDLEAICLRCLEKEPGRRYGSAEALADELRRYLEGKPTLARPRRWYERGWRRVRNRPWVAAAAVLCLAAPLVVYFFSPPARPPLDPDQERKWAEEELKQGRPYVFEGSEPLTGPFRWVGSLEGRPTPNVAEGCFSLESLDRCLLELTPDSGSDHYLFALECRHDDAGGTSDVGLFFGLRQTPKGPAGAKYGYYTVAFADRGFKTKRAGPKGEDKSYLELYAHAGGKERDHPNDVKTVLSFRPVPLAQPGVWRKLGVRVTPEEISVFWRNEQGGWQLIDRIAVSLLENRFRWITRTSPEVAEIAPAFSPRQGLGLYVSRGRASFRRVELTPLQVNEGTAKENP
jgi:serine/threonine-protein kinase